MLNGESNWRLSVYLSIIYREWRSEEKLCCISVYHINSVFCRDIMGTFLLCHKLPPYFFVTGQKKKPETITVLIVSAANYAANVAEA